VRPEQIRSIYLPPDKTARMAKESRCVSIAYTYSEPTIFFEYMEDTAIAGKEIGVKSVVITAAYISEKPLIQLCQNVDAIKVDLKAFTESFYKDVVNGELKPVPIHFTRFHPYYLIKYLPPTPVKTLNRAWEIARSEGLNYVYIGNVPGHPAENTICPNCDEKVVTRNGFFVRDIKIHNGLCTNCSHEIAGIWGQ
jgi:pyruvate formate lyase activating enzyme